MKRVDLHPAQLYLDVAGVMFVVVNKNQQVTLINQKGCEILGYRQEEIIEKNWFDNFLPKHIREQTKAVFQTLMAGKFEPAEYFENPVLTKRGEERLIAWHNTIIRDNNGLITATLSSGEDITERKQVEQALRQSEANFGALLESAPIGIVMVSEEGRIVLVNTKTEEMFGYLREELVGQSVELLLPQRLHAAHVEYRTRYLANLRARPMGAGFDLVGRRQDGTEFPVEIGLSYVQSESRVLVTSFITDITERRRAQERLQETQRILSTLMSNLPGLAYRGHNDQNRTMEFVSEGCFHLTGYHPDDMIENRKVAYGQLIHPDDQEATWHKVQTALQKKHPFQLSYRLTTASGEEKWAWEQGRGVFSPEGALLALEGFVTDNTERVLAYQTLEQRVEERTHELERRRQVAEGLRDILAILNSDRSLDEILDYIVAQAVRLLEARASAVYRLQDKAELLTIRTSQGLPAEYIAQANIVLGTDTTGRAVLTRQPVAVPDITSILTEGGVKTQARRQLPEPHEFSVEEIELAVTFADQVALAIENARLRTQVERTAVAAERSRLARDLHDAVTQTLFSASLIAEVLPRLWKRNPDEGKRRLEELRQLAQGALAEMRTLLLELRPSRLTQVPLKDLLRQLTEAVSGRARVPITLNVKGQCSLPPDVKVSLYRTAQEALNNVAKHAQASQATVSLHCRPEHVKLSINDDGRGFTLKGVTPDNLGLTIMHERAEAIGAALEIESQLGRGTQVVVVWENKQQTKDK
jgi:PAS domain S-box-containing protein